jgi:hypothetical protein
MPGTGITFSVSMTDSTPQKKKKKIADLFRTTRKVKTQHVVKSRGQQCGDIELAGYLANEAGPVPLVLDLRIAHDRVGPLVVDLRIAHGLAHDSVGRWWWTSGFLMTEWSVGAGPPDGS